MTDAAADGAARRPLRPWSHELRVQREWKRALRGVSKARILEILAPLVLEVLAEICDEDLGDPRHLERWRAPRERAAAAARAVQTLIDRGPRAGVELERLADPGNGLIARAAERIAAARTLIAAMASENKVAARAMQCIGHLVHVRPEMGDRIAREL